MGYYNNLGTITGSCALCIFLLACVCPIPNQFCITLPWGLTIQLVYLIRQCVYPGTLKKQCISAYIVLPRLFVACIPCRTQCNAANVSCYVSDLSAPRALVDQMHVILQQFKIGWVRTWNVAHRTVTYTYICKDLYSNVLDVCADGAYKDSWTATLCHWCL